jgi:hypothetical protein
MDMSYYYVCKSGSEFKYEKSTRRGENMTNIGLHETRKYLAAPKPTHYFT